MHELYTGKYVPTEYDASWREPMWQRVFEEAGGDEQAARIVDAFKTFYTMYTDDLVRWYANLYDPYIGGYYCTTSGKENEGYLPDIESSCMALTFIESSGLADHAGRDWRNVIPDEMKKKFVRLAKRMQEPNGFFYNLLKTREEIDAYLPKRGRDLGWCTRMLNELGESPTYDTPNGLKGNGIDADGNPVALPYALSPSSGEDKTPVPKVNYASYLENRETFLNYLNERININGRSYHAGNELNATYKQIKYRDEMLKAENTDYSLCDTLIEWLNKRIDPNTGYWTPEVSFVGSNGFFKVITIYNVWGYPYPEIEKVTDSIIAGILGDEPTVRNSCEVYNLWEALASCKRNVKFQPESIKDNVLYNIEKKLKDNAPEAILNTFKKQSGYQKPDGAFSHMVNGGLKTHQGDIPIGLGLDEGDVDAIGKGSTGTLKAIFEAFEYTPVPIYHEREWKIYKEILDNAQPIIKKNTPMYR